MRLAPVLASVLALCAGPAVAQTFDGTQGVDTYTGPVISPARITGLGGAFVGVAEGLDGALANPAAVAQRGRDLERGWDWDWLLTWYVPDPRDVAAQDLGNDGKLDAALSGLGNAQPLPEWLRARGGTYLEPSRTGGSPRLHGTFGVEGRIPFFRGYALKLGLAGDLAERFRNVSLSLGFWSSFAPCPPAS